MYTYVCVHLIVFCLVYACKHIVTAVMWCGIRKPRRLHTCRSKQEQFLAAGVVVAVVEDDDIVAVKASKCETQENRHLRKCSLNPNFRRSEP